jgi:hypothetical protein
LGTGLYASAFLKEDDFVDDSALDNALSDDEDMLESINLSDHLSRIDSAAPAEVPPREGLYSTPLSWEKPQPGLRMDPLMGIGGVGNIESLARMGSLVATPAFGNIGAPILNEAEQRRLLAIAMNTGRTPSGFAGFGLPLGAGFGSGFGSGFDAEFDSGFDGTSLSQASNMPDRGTARSKTESKATSEEESKPAMQPPPRPPLSRNNTGPSDKGKDKDKDKDYDKGIPKGGDRTAHNDIERKYRTNLKDRISELRDAVPALKSMPEEGADDGSASSRSLKVSKVGLLCGIPDSNALRPPIADAGY